MKPTTTTYALPLHKAILARLKDVSELTKLRLSLLVVFSAVIAYLIAADQATFMSAMVLSLAGYLVTGSSNAINQILEKDSDKLMTRTMNRPLPSGRMGMIEASLVGGIFGVAGIALLAFYFNPLSGVLGALALISYAFIYTPFKKVSPSSVFVGAVPGSMPLLIGWTAATGSIGLGGLVLFAIQFLWQIPHFWAIAWILHEDYQKAGFSLLPSAEGKTRSAALQNIPYLIGLLLVGTLPFFLGMSGMISLVVVAITAGYYLICGIQLSADVQDKSAKKLMFASFIYLPVAFLALLLDKI